MQDGEVWTPMHLSAHPELIFGHRYIDVGCLPMLFGLAPDTSSSFMSSKGPPVPQAACNTPPIFSSESSTHAMSYANHDFCRLNKDGTIEWLVNVGAFLDDVTNKIPLFAYGGNLQSCTSIYIGPILTCIQYRSEDQYTCEDSLHVCL